MKFTMQRDRVIATTMGHAIEFKKGVPTHVPPECWAIVQQHGAIPEEDIPDPEVKALAPSDPIERKNAIKKAMTTIVARNQREDFTAAGLPHTKVVSMEVKFPIDSKERDLVWDELRSADPDT